MAQYIDGLQFNNLFNSISTISGGWKAGNEILCPLENRLRLERFPPPVEFEPATTVLAGQRLTHWTTVALLSRGFTWNIQSYFLWKTMNKYLWMLSAAVVIGALRVNPVLNPL